MHTPGDSQTTQNTLPAESSHTVEEAKATRRSRLFHMGVAYALGTFNDNFFKQAGLLLAAAVGLIGVQGKATMFFALPFVAFSAWAGWLADRLPKKNIVIWAKGLEILSMLLAVWYMYTLAWGGIVLVVFLMGLQSTFFSPAINGSIPENFDPSDVPKVNANLKLATTLTILLGIALAGPVLEIPAPAFLRDALPQFGSQEYAFGRLCVGVLVMLVAVTGLFAALRINGRLPETRSKAAFPLLGPLHSAQHALNCKRADLPLFLALICEAFFYFVSSFTLLCITNLGKAQLGFSMTITSLLAVDLMVGICAGSLIAGRWPVQAWCRYTFVAGLGLGLGLALAAICPLLPASLQLPLLFVFLILAGICGGLYLIPVVSFIQVRPAAHEKGKILGVSNFACFTGIMIAGPLFSFLLDPTLSLTPAKLMAGAGLFVSGFMLLLRRSLKTAAENNAANCQNELLWKDSLAALRPGWLGYFLRGLLALRYRITARGLEHIRAAGKQDTRPFLFLPNHPALVDAFIVYSLLAGSRPSPLADAGRLSGLWGYLAKLFIKVVTIPDMGRSPGSASARQGVLDGLSRISQALCAGDAVLLYPSGRIYRSGREVIGGNSGLARILSKTPTVRVVLVRSSGLWGSSFSFAGAGGNPEFGKTLLRGLLTLLANGLFFTPRRPVEVEFVEAEKVPDWPVTGQSGVDKKALNAWLENFYNQKSTPALAVPRFFWQGLMGGSKLS